MKKIKLILLAAVIMSYHYAQGYTMTVTNKLKWSVGKVKVGVSNDFCGDNVQGPLKPGETSIHEFTGFNCGPACFNKLEIQSIVGDTDRYFPVKERDGNGGYKDLSWGLGPACGSAEVDIVEEKKGFFVVEYTGKGKWA